MRVNPIVFYEVLLNSTIDKVFEFNDIVIFYNIAIPGPSESSNKIVIKIVKKGNVAAMFCNDVDLKEFDFLKVLEDWFEFREKANENYMPSINENYDWKDSLAIIKK